MPAWSVALLVAFVGLASAAIGTFANIASERGKDLRTRMLDAADEFVTAVTRAHEKIGLAALPTGAWVEIAWMDMSDAMRDDRQGKVEAANAAASSAWENSRQRVPRIALLFGVDSAAAEAARRADDALGEALLGLTMAYAETHNPEAEPQDENLVAERASEQLEVATAELRAFSTAAHAAITGWRPLRRRVVAAE